MADEMSSVNRADVVSEDIWLWITRKSVSLMTCEKYIDAYVSYSEFLFRRKECETGKFEDDFRTREKTLPLVKISPQLDTILPNFCKFPCMSRIKFTVVDLFFSLTSYKYRTTFGRQCVCPLFRGFVLHLYLYCRTSLPACDELFPPLS